MTESQSYDPVDPLAEFSSLSLFPRTFRVPTGATPRPPPPYDMDALQAYLKSIPISSPLKLKEQAKAILDNGSGLLNVNIPSYAASEVRNETAAAKGRENPHERRPALGRKRAQFSMRPDSAQPSDILEPSLDIDLLQDPEEYFLAHEKLENAKKEIQRQNGTILMDQFQHRPSRVARQRRPGILRKSVSYRHHGSSVVSNAENFVSQDTYTPDTLSTSYCQVQKEPTELSIGSEEKELDDSVIEAEHKVGDILDELLSSNFEDLEGNGAVTLLQERLQIKPIHLEKVRLPDLHAIRRGDFGVSKSHRNALADVQNMLLGVSEKTPLKRKQLEEISGDPLASSTPPRSPLGSIHSLKKRIVHSHASSHSFAVLSNFSPARKFPHLEGRHDQADHSDASPAKNSNPIEINHDQSDNVVCSEGLSDPANLRTLMVEEDDNNVANCSLREALVENSAIPSYKAVGESGSDLSFDPLTAINDGCSPAKNGAPIKGYHEQADHVDTSERLSDAAKLKPPFAQENDVNVARSGSHEALVEHLTIPLDKSVSDNGSTKFFDSFTAVHNDLLLARTSCPIEGHNDQSDHVDSSERLSGSADKLIPPLLVEDDSRVVKLGPHEALVERPAHLSDKSMVDDGSNTLVDSSKAPDDDLASAKISNPVDASQRLIGSGKSKARMVEVDETSVSKFRSDVQIAERAGSGKKGSSLRRGKRASCIGSGKSKAHMVEVDEASVSKFRSDVQIAEHTGCGKKGSSLRRGKRAKGVPQEVVGLAGSDCDVDDSTMGNMDNSGSLLAQSSPGAFEPRTSDVDLEQQTKDIQEQSVEVLVEKSKAKTPSPRRRKRKDYSTRQSLAGAGLKWESGVRRSTRIKMRPLEYWKGERFLYGRIHKSLATVIGVKYMSPGKGEGGPTVTVKSFVSDQYRDLVEQVALH